MPSEIYEQLLEAYSDLNNITESLSLKKFLILPDGKLKFKEFYTPKSLELSLTNDIDAFMDKLERLSFFFIDDQLGGLKKLSFKRINDIKIITQATAKNQNYTYEHLQLYKEFRAVQRQIKNNFLKLLQDINTPVKSFQYTWLGSQRELVELFDVLITKGWIQKDSISDEMLCLPIIEMFNIKKGDISVPLNEMSFKKAWQRDVDVRNPRSYIPVFDTLKKKV